MKVDHSDQLGCSVSNGSHVLFKPEVEPLGLHSHESLVTVQDNGCVLVPVQNPEGTSICLDEGLNVGVVRYNTDCFEVRNYNGVEECNGVCGSSLVSCEVLGEESLSGSVVDEVSSEELSSGSVVGEVSSEELSSGSVVGEVSSEGLSSGR